MLWKRDQEGLAPTNFVGEGGALLEGAKRQRCHGREGKAVSKARLKAFSNRSFSAGFEAECGSQEDEHRQRHGVRQKHRIYQPSIATTPAQHPELARRCLFQEERQHKPDERRGADCDDRPNHQEDNLGVDATLAI